VAPTRHKSPRASAEVSDRLGDVRPAHRPARLGLDGGVVEADAGLGQLFQNLAIAGVAVFAQVDQGVGKGAWAGGDPQSQDVNARALAFHGEFAAGYGLDARFASGGEKFLQAVHGVVVGQGHGGKPGPMRHAGDFPGGVGSVGSRGVGVQVDKGHNQSSQARLRGACARERSGRPGRCLKHTAFFFASRRRGRSYFTGAQSVPLRRRGVAASPHRRRGPTDNRNSKNGGILISAGTGWAQRKTFPLPFVTPLRQGLGLCRGPNETAPAV